LEEWLSTITRVGFSGGEGEEGAHNTMLGAMMEQMSEQMDGIARMYAQTGQDQAHVQSHLMAMTASLEKLTQKLDQGQTEALERVAASQERMIARMGEGGGGDGMDAESRMRLRSIDVQMLRVLEEVSSGRQESLSEIRSDLANLTKAIRALSNPTSHDQS
jgi:hypothetical protein